MYHKKYTTTSIPTKAMIIFGWGHKMIKNFGPTFRHLCTHCNNEEYWVLTRVMTWFTLFFIPIFPYEIKYFLTCPICQYGSELKRDQIDSIKPLAEANQLLIDGKITKEEYESKINLLNSGDKSGHVSSEPRDVEHEVLESNQNLAFCSECGKEVTKEIKFCGSCGAQTALNK